MKLKALFNISRWGSSYFWADVNREISSFFNPRQKWLTKKIPNTWCDKVELLRLACFESILHYVEEENAFEILDWEWSPEQIEAKKDFERAYDLVKNEIPFLEKQLEMHWDNYPNRGGTFMDSFIKKDGEEFATMKPPSEESKRWTTRMIEMDGTIERLTQEVCDLVIKNRNIMWT